MVDFPASYVSFREGTHFGGSKTLQIYGKFEGFPL